MKKIVKKILLFLISAALTGSSMGIAVIAENKDTDEIVYISNITTETEGQIKFTVNNLNSVENKDNIVAYAAEYDKNNNIIGIGLTDVEVTKSSEDININYNMHGGNKLKVFVWDTNMTPLAAAAEKAEPVNVYVTIADSGNIVTSKDNEYVVHKLVEVNDLNNDGRLNIDEALYAVHEQFYSDGSSGYMSYIDPTYGLSLSRLWGDEGGAFGYYVNDESSWGLDDEVKEGDYLKAFIYADKTNWSDTYSYFDKPFIETKAGDEITISLFANCYDENWNIAALPYSGASVKLADDTKILGTTNENGEVALKFDEAGIYTVIAEASEDADFKLVPAAITIKVN